MKLLTKIHLTLFGVLFLVGFFTYASLSSAGASDIITLETTTAMGDVTLERPEVFFAGETYSIILYFRQTGQQGDQHFVQRYELEINGDEIPIYGQEYVEDISSTRVEWHLVMPPAPYQSLEAVYYIYVYTPGSSVEREQIYTDTFYIQEAGVAGAPCDIEYSCDPEFECTPEGYCMRPLGEEGAPCISYSECNWENDLICYVDWDQDPNGDNGVCVRPIIVGLGEDCDWEYRRCNETAQHYCMTPDNICVAELGTEENPLYGIIGSPCNGIGYLCEEPFFCNLTSQTCEEELTTQYPTPIFVGLGEICDDIDYVFCEDPYECVANICEDTRDPCAQIDCGENHTCYEGQCVYCPPPHEMNETGTCEIHCLEHSAPRPGGLTIDASACACELYYEQNDTDTYNRPVCAPIPLTTCNSILDCEENYTCIEEECTPCPAPYKRINIAGECIWDCGRGTNTQPDNSASATRCECKPGFIPNGTDEQGRLHCRLKPWDYCGPNYLCDANHTCTDNVCVKKEIHQRQEPTINETEQEQQEPYMRPVVKKPVILHEEIIEETREEEVHKEYIPPLREEGAIDDYVNEVFKNKNKKNTEISEAERKLHEEKINEAQARAQEELNIEKIITVKQVTREAEENTTYNKTEITIQITPKIGQESIDIIEIIPKELAEMVAELEFSVPPIILQDDPVVMWHLENVNEETNITYSVNKTTSITGNTMALASVEQPFNWRVLLPLLFIPLFAFVVIIFDKLRSSPKEKIF